MDTHKKIREHISTLCDGESSQSDLELAFAALRTEDGRQAWKDYFQIGDVLREQATPEFSEGFAARLAAELAHEDTPQLSPYRSATPLTHYGNLIGALHLGMAADMNQAAHDLIALLRELSSQVIDKDMVRLTVRARDVLVVAKGKGQLAGAPFLQAMMLCAKHWKRLHPQIASTGLAVLERAVVDSHNLASTPLALRAASEHAGTVAWLYELSALVGEDVTERLAHNPRRVPGTRYHACYTGNVLQYLQCGASYNVNQFMRIDSPELTAPPLVITGECKGGSSGYGMVKGPRAFMVSQGVAYGIIHQQDKLYPLSRAMYMARANTTAPAGKVRKLAGKAIEQAGLDGLLVYLVVRGRIDIEQQSISSEIEILI